MRWLFAGIAAIALALLGKSDAALAHGWIADDGCGPGLSDDEYFYAAGDEWWTYYSGYGGCGMATLNTNQVYDEFAEWYLPGPEYPNPSNYNHNFDIWTSIDYPYCSSQNFTDAHYHAYRLGHSGGITAHKWWDQTGHCHGGWYKIASNSLCSTNGGFWDMWDNTYNPAGAYLILVDAILFNPKTSSHTC